VYTATVVFLARVPDCILTVILTLLVTSLTENTVLLNPIVIPGKGVGKLN